MSPRFARVRPEMSVDEAISYLRRQARQRLETIYYAYVLDREQRLLGVVSFRDLFLAAREDRSRRHAHRRGHRPRRHGPGEGGRCSPSTT
jgi:magnesium transporter